MGHEKSLSSTNLTQHPTIHFSCKIAHCLTSPPSLKTKGNTTTHTTHHMSAPVGLALPQSSSSPSGGGGSARGRGGGRTGRASSGSSSGSNGSSSSGTGSSNKSEAVADGTALAPVGVLRPKTRRIRASSGHLFTCMQCRGECQCQSREGGREGGRGGRTGGKAASFAGGRGLAREILPMIEALHLIYSRRLTSLPPSLPPSHPLSTKLIFTP